MKQAGGASQDSVMRMTMENTGARSAGFAGLRGSSSPGADSPTRSMGVGSMGVVSSGSEAPKVDGAKALGGAVTQAERRPVGERVVDAWGRAWGLGRRKTSVARVILSRGSGKITINGRDFEDYIHRDTARLLVQRILEHARLKHEVDVKCRVRGGGTSGQAGAIGHGIARALVNYDPTLRPIMGAEGFLTRDSRMVERKKYGLRKARRAFQFSKR